MMFGGVAKTYVNWDLIGEPFKENGRLYIMAKKPDREVPKQVRWYTDKEHNEMMPHYKPPKPIHEVFGFKTRDGHILTISEKVLTETEVRQYFAGKWRHTTFCGGIWYAPEDAVFPLPNKPYRKLTFDELAESAGPLWRAKYCKGE